MLSRPSEWVGRSGDRLDLGVDGQSLLPSYPQNWRLDGPGKHENLSLPTMNIFAFGHDTLNKLDERPETPEKVSDVEGDAPQNSRGSAWNLQMAHNFPVYAEGLSVCSNGVTLIYREP